jgi:hypothetical protein
LKSAVQENVRRSISSFAALASVEQRQSVFDRRWRAVGGVRAKITGAGFIKEACVASAVSLRL